MAGQEHHTLASHLQSLEGCETAQSASRRGSCDKFALEISYTIGLRSQNQLSRDMFQQAILAQCVQTSQQVDSLNVRSHLLKESARMFVGGDGQSFDLLNKKKTVHLGRPCLAFKLEATAHTKIDVFVGVQQAAMQRVLGGSSSEKGKKKKEKDSEELLPLKEGEYLHKASYSWTWGNSVSCSL